MPKETVWTLDPHTKAKHSILRRYLQGYYPKMASAQSRLVFVDGFAGPGRYKDEEAGSPVIALDALTEHSYFPKMSGSEFVFLFIEERKGRFEELRSILADRDDPPNVKVAARLGTFEEHMTEVLDGLGENQMAPAFVMVDPFGVKGLPLELLRRLAAFPKTELLVSFMYEAISRWLAQPEFEPHLDALFGTPEWREAMGLPADEKRALLSDLYANQLRGIGMEYVRLFEMRDAGNRTEYFLAFGTHHKDGLRLIKEAMWKIDAAGGVVFSDFTAPSEEQGTLLEAQPDLGQLRSPLFSRFADQSAVRIADINDYVLVETAFRETHGKRVLRDAEKSGAIDVRRPPGKTKAYWNIGTRVKFPPAE